MNYLELTDEQLRLEVAKRKGIVRIQYSSSADDGDMIWAVQMLEERNHGFAVKEYRQTTCPEWATDIRAAFGLLEEIRPHFFRTLLICWDHGTSWAVVCDERTGHDEPRKGIDSTAPTAPRAIVIAWLMLDDQRTSK